MSKHFLKLLPCEFCLPCDEKWISLSQELCLHLLYIITWIRDMIIHCAAAFFYWLKILFLCLTHLAFLTDRTTSLSKSAQISFSANWCCKGILYSVRARVALNLSKFCLWSSVRCTQGQKPCQSQNVLVCANRCGSFIRTSVAAPLTLLLVCLINTPVWCWCYTLLALRHLSCDKPSAQKQMIVNRHFTEDTVFQHTPTLHLFCWC